MRPDAPSANPSHDGSEAPGSPAAAPAGRPKLNLTKRTVSEAVDAPATSGDVKASPFGAARPIDTAAKEREIEEKRIAALKDKKEADDKAREEKKAKEAEAAAAAAVADVTQKTEALDIADGEAKKEAKPVEAPKPSESAWRKPAAAAAPKSAQADAPRAPRRDGPSRGGRTDNRAPRNDNRAPRANGGEKAAAPATPATPATPAVEAEAAAAAQEDDGWSTVQKPKKTQRGGRN